MNPQDALKFTVASIEERNRKIVSAFKGQVYIGNHMDVQLGHLWDSIEFKAGEDLRSFELFKTPLRPGRSFADSNMYTSDGVLDAPMAFSLQRIFFTFSHSALDEDVYAVAESIAWTLWIGHKYFLRTPIVLLAPVRYCEVCLAPYAAAEKCPRCGNQECKPDIQARKCFFLDIPELNWLVIANQMSFYVECEKGKDHRFTKDLKMWCHFQGLIARGVQ